jgi:O-antigen ligase
MYLEPSQIFQLSAAVIGAIVILVAAYAMPLRVSVGILLVMIPFQPIETRFGSANILMTYVLFGALLLRRRLQYVPMLGRLLLVLFAYLLSISQLNPALYFDHGLHLFFVVSGLLMFILAYNMAREVENPRYIINLLIAANVLAAIYCAIQFTAGPGERMIFFGIDELWMHRNRGHHDPRLVGPFGSPTISSAYFMSMTVLITYEILHSMRYKRVALIALAVANVVILLGTANRGSFLVLIVSLLGFLYLFREQLGAGRAIKILIASVVILAATGTFVATYTQFGNMFSRLESVADFEGGLPDTRQQVWPRAWSAITEKPWVGHGPMIWAPRGLERSGQTVHPDQLVMEYPHNLYLHLLVTLGVLGTACMLLFLFGVTWRICRGATKGGFAPSYDAGLVLVGALMAVGFLVDELKIEFLRHSSIDYQHFVFAVFGIFLGFADRARRQQNALEETQSGYGEGIAREYGKSPSAWQGARIA